MPGFYTFIYHLEFNKKVYNVELMNFFRRLVNKDMALNWLEELMKGKLSIVRKIIFSFKLCRFKNGNIFALK